MKPKCCFLATEPSAVDGYIQCDKDAEWVIGYGPTTYDFTDRTRGSLACTEHVGALLTDAKEHKIYAIY